MTSNILIKTIHIILNLHLFVFIDCYFRFSKSEITNKYEMNYLSCKGNETALEDCDHRHFDMVSDDNLAGVECIAHGKKRCDN